MFRKRKYIPSGSLSSLAWRRFMANTPAMVSLAFVVLLVLIAVLGYLITPDPTPFANSQYPELTARKPGFSVSMLRITDNSPHNKVSWFRKMIFGAESPYTFIPIHKFDFRNDEITVEEFTGDSPNDGDIKTFSLPDVLYALSPDAPRPVKVADSMKFTLYGGEVMVRDITGMQTVIARNCITTRKFLLGTDRYGRDVLSQIMIGTRVSLSVGFISVIISLIIGILLGAMAGYFRGAVDAAIMWFINVVWSIPTLLLVIAITFVLGKGFWQIFIAVGLTMWVEVARVVRGQIISVREKEYVEAARALGYRHGRIIFRHILPNVMAPVIVISAANFASAILIEAGLSFLGIGVQPPMPSWGTMIKEHYGYIILDSAYLAIIPGVAIMLTVLAFMLAGNALRDALDVKTTGRREG